MGPGRDLTDAAPHTMAAESPTCEFTFLAASARSKKIAAHARKAIPLCGGTTGH